MSEHDEHAALDAIRARLEAATPGPWEYTPGIFKHYVTIGEHHHFGLQELNIADGHETNAEADAKLIAHAPADLRVLLAEVGRLTAERDAADLKLAALAASLNTASAFVGLGEHETAATRELLERVAAERDKARATLAAIRLAIIQGGLPVDDGDFLELVVADAMESRQRWIEAAHEKDQERDALREALTAFVNTQEYGMLCFYCGWREDHAEDCPHTIARKLLEEDK